MRMLFIRDDHLGRCPGRKSVCGRPRGALRVLDSCEWQYGRVVAAPPALHANGQVTPTIRARAERPDRQPDARHPNHFVKGSAVACQPQQTTAAVSTPGATGEVNGRFLDPV